MIKDLKFIILIFFCSNKLNTIINWLLFIFILIFPFLNYIFNGSNLNMMISVTSQFLGLTISLFSSSVGMWAKTNNLRILQGYGFKIKNAFLTILAITIISSLPNVFYLVISEKYADVLILIIFCLFINFSLIVSTNYISRRIKSVKSLIFLCVLIVSFLTTSLSLCSNEVTKNYSLFYIINKIEIYKTYLIYFTIISFISIVTFYQIRKIEKINWNKWNK